jgi:glycosyltransferase involved in cell wall biosynthesis
VTTEPTLRLAIVVQRYGEKVSGGAELHARWLAEHLLPYADIDVLTTCALDYITWADHFPPGIEQINGVTVRRFPVDHERRIDQLTRTSNFVLNSSHSILDEYDWLKIQGPTSSALLQFVAEQRDNYDIFILFSYEYATTYFAMQVVPDKALLVPTAHDNAVLRLPLFRNTFHLPRYIAYNTAAERQFVNRITRNQQVPGLNVGIGINIPDDIDAGRVRAHYDLPDKFLLYIGRIDPAKNVSEMLDFYCRYYDETPDPAALVLIGRPVMPLPDHPGIIRLGHVSEQDKFDALQAATLLLLPSLQESLSMVILEAWLAGTPVMVDGGCIVTKQQVQLSNGGVYYHDYFEFSAGLQTLLNSAELCASLGRQGQKFAQENYNWDTIVTKYLHMFNAILSQ